MSKVANGPLLVKEEPVEVTEPAAIVSPSFLNYVNDLRGLSPTLSIFINRFKELEEHLGFIHNAIDSLSSSTEDQSNDIISTSTLDVSKIPVLDDDPTVTGDSVVKTKDPENSIDDTFRSTLDHLCQTMCGRGLRKYIASHLSDIAKLRREAPIAFKRAPNLPQLVLGCVGRFYLQGKNAFSRESPMITARQASFLILEFFLLAGCTHIEQSVKQEAEVAALAWRDRLLTEGGVSTATSADARGLLLFVASYGIPFEFGTGDLINLIRLSNPLEIADALRQSPFLSERIPDVIQQMVKSGMCVAAADTAFTFGLEDKFSPLTVLTSFLRESKEAWKKARGESQGAPVKLKEANEKHLAALKSVIRCLEEHKIDPKVLAGWNINLKVAKLENDISNFGKIIEERAISKRKVEELESSMKLRPQDGKHFCSKIEGSPQISFIVTQSQEQSTVCLAKRKSLYDTGFPVVLDGYSGASSGTSGAGILPSATVGNGNMVGGVGGFLSGVSSGRRDLMPTNLVTGFGGGLHQGDGAIQQTDNSIRSFGWRGDGAPSNNFIAHNFTELPASTVRGSFGLTLASEQRFIGQPSASLSMGNQCSDTDLYQFADTVLEGESNYSSSSQMGISRLAAAAAAAAAHVHRSSYLH